MGALRSLKTLAATAFSGRQLPIALREQVRRDRKGLTPDDPGVENTIEATMAWLCRAQDHSASADGGVSAFYSLKDGWSSSYPETTGYIVSTFLDYAEREGSELIRRRARLMLDWLVTIQMPCGAFQGGRIDSKPVVPVTFNTGQILLGLAGGERSFHAYREPMRRAADWLVEVQDKDGCWRKYPSPFAAAGEKTYDTHIAWALFEAARIDPGRGYEKAALANIEWALTWQRSNGWMDNCCLDTPAAPLTHTLGYALRGIIEAYRFTCDVQLLNAALKTARGLMSALKGDGFLPGQLASDWSGTVNWACLTGTAQIATCWLMLFQDTGDPHFRDAALAANRYVRRTVSFHQAADINGGVKGSFPVDGDYGKYQYLNWAAKFLVDSLVLERDCCAGIGVCCSGGV
jgi:hypothetical protein